MAGTSSQTGIKPCWRNREDLKSGLPNCHTCMKWEFQDTSLNGGLKNDGAYIPFVRQARWLMLLKFFLDQQRGGNRANDSSQDSDVGLQNITIPRLQLLACCIMACLTSSIRERMDLENFPVFYWTGSSTENTGGHLSTITWMRFEAWPGRRGGHMCHVLSIQLNYPPASVL
jgi:hypothetical protein